MKTAALPLLLSALVLAPVAANSADRPPEKAKSMRDIVVQLEEAKYGPITDVSFDDGQWEVEAVKDEVPMELNIDAMTGDVLAEYEDDDEDARPAKDAKPLSEILSELADADWSPIVEASFERRTWEVEAFRGDAKHELHVDAASGKVLSDRIDD